MSENASNNNKASALIKRFNDLALLNTSNTATTANPSAQTSPLNIPLSPNKSTFPELTSPSTAALNPFKTTLNSPIQNTNAQSSISPLEFLKSNTDELSLLLYQTTQPMATNTISNQAILDSVGPIKSQTAQHTFSNLKTPLDSSLSDSRFSLQPEKKYSSFSEKPNNLKLKQSIKTYLSKEAEIDKDTSALTKNWLILASNCFTKASELHQQKKIEEAYIFYMKLSM
ncbi:hypothetical protein BB561_004490 [Smittium simulii]|uniref:Uncharacterized protein n=1 Tax=Smittium simulii TaxID=133385 RepID=A0A2T9YG16_9FUNG|nr:hypothetical protein BB561_004490 [Smittium simulii]